MSESQAPIQTDVQQTPSGRPITVNEDRSALRAHLYPDRGALTPEDIAGVSGTEIPEGAPFIPPTPHAPGAQIEAPTATASTGGTTRIIAPDEIEDDPNLDPRTGLDRTICVLDGRLVDNAAAVRIKKTSSWHDDQMDQLMGLGGLSLSGMGQARYLRALTMCAIDSEGHIEATNGTPRYVEDKPVLTPRKWRDVEARLQKYDTPQSLRMSRTYSEVNGIGREGDATFSG